MVQTPHLAGLLLHDRLPERDLTVAGHDDFLLVTNRKNGGGVHPATVKFEV
jgi:hypothetical protein